MRKPTLGQAGDLLFWFLGRAGLQPRVHEVF